jgi:hypothetical protein
MTVPVGRSYRPPVGFPNAQDKRGRWQAPIVSIVLHALVVFLLLIPAAVSVEVAVRPAWGFRGAVKGGGGGGQHEHVHFVMPARAAAVARPAVRRPIPPAPVRRIVPAPVAPLPTPQIATTEQVGAPPGVGSIGLGPGTGGGTGAGVGTGAGNGTGPGTAGEPTAQKLRAVLPETIPVGLDAPKDARPRHLTAIFIVAADGSARLVSFTPTNDGGYNHRLHDAFEQMTRPRWQPAALNGVAVADTVAYDVYLP